MKTPLRSNLLIAMLVIAVAGCDNSGDSNADKQGVKSWAP